MGFNVSYFGTSEWYAEVARGNVSGASIVHKFGRNTAIGTSFGPVAFGGVFQTVQPAAATALRVKAGGNANDTAAGTGAREITLVGVDATGAEISEAVATAGASASSATTATFIRLHRAFVSGSGTYATFTTGSHSGDIVIENAAGGTDWATIDSTSFPISQSEIGAYTIPTGKLGFVLYAETFTDSSKTTNLVFFRREGVTDAAAPYQAMREVFEISTQGGSQIINPTSPIGPFTGPCDIGFLAKVDTGTAEVDVDFEILLVDA